MPRRRSGLQPLHLAGAALFLALAAGAFWFFGREKGDQLDGYPLPPEQYGSNKVVRGNTYLLTGTVLKQLGFDANSARLVSFEVKDPDSRALHSIPVLIPAEFRDLNIQVGQEFQMTVIAEQNTVLRAKDIRKS